MQSLKYSTVTVLYLLLALERLFVATYSLPRCQVDCDQQLYFEKCGCTELSERKFVEKLVDLALNTVRHPYNRITCNTTTTVRCVTPLRGQIVRHRRDKCAKNTVNTIQTKRTYKNRPKAHKRPNIAIISFKLSLIEFSSFLSDCHAHCHLPPCRGRYNLESQITITSPAYGEKIAETLSVSQLCSFRRYSLFSSHSMVICR